MQPPRADFPPIHFDGQTYEPEHDEGRLRSQLWRVLRFMSDEREHTLAEIAHGVGGTEASVSARLRDLRKPRFGGWLVDRRRIFGGLFGYTLRRREPVVVVEPEPVTMRAMVQRDLF